MTKIYGYIVFCLVILLWRCEDYYNTDNDAVIYGEAYFKAALNTDKACYKPGETVNFTLSEKPSGNVKVKYSHLGNVISEEALSSASWSWTAPSCDYKGYMVNIYEIADGNSMEWRDTNGTQKEPGPVADIQIKVTASKAVSNVWVASPDTNGGVACKLDFSQSGSDVLITIPSFKYWDMVVLEY